ncbi:MAG: hypothetical protein S4CHLAM123_12830 [Chlamydiales bacterium]|nr:hypothetical protein [Chlamydiales bacterium]
MSCITRGNFEDGLILENMRESLVNKISQKTRLIANRGTISGRVVVPLACAGALITSVAMRIVSTIEPLLAILGDIAFAIKDLNITLLIAQLIVRPFIQFPILTLMQTIGMIHDCVYKGSGIVTGLASPKFAHQNLKNDF